MNKRKLRAAVRAECRNGGAVYFIRQGNFVKVGLSRDPWSRLHALQSASPVPLSLVGLIPSTDTKALEKRLHGLWRGRAERGEWYRLSADDIGRGLASLSLSSSYIDLDELRRDIQRELEMEHRGARRKPRAMRHNQRLSDSELQEEARLIMEGRNQSETAREMGVHRSLIEASSPMLSTPRHPAATPQRWRKSLSITPTTQSNRRR